MQYTALTNQIKNKRLVAGLFLVFTLSLGFAAYSSVKDHAKGDVAGQTLVVSPPSQEVTVDPGQTITIKAKVTNKSKESLPMTVKAEDFTANGDQGQVSITSNSKYSVAGWTRVYPSTFTLAAGDTEEVTATITAPRDAAGGRFGSFVFSVKPNKAEANAATVSQQIASLFLVRINGEVTEKLALTEMKSPIFQEFGPVNIDMRFANSGNIHVKAKGLVNVKDFFGNRVADIIVQETNILPEVERVIQAKLNKSFLVGPYTATAIIYYGSANDVLNAQTTFYVFPVRIAAVVLAVLVILFLLRKRIKKAYKAMK